MTKTALRQILAEWLNERQRNLSPENSVHIHVDEVMKGWADVTIIQSLT